MRPPVEEKQQESTPQQEPIGNRLPENDEPLTVIDPITTEAEANPASDASPPVTLLASPPNLALETSRDSVEQTDSRLEQIRQEFQDRLEVYLARPRTFSEPIPPFLSTKGLKAALEKLESGEDVPRRKRGKNTDPHGGKG